MNVLSEVLIIAVGTALLAALLVAADVDLAVIRAGQVLRDRWVGVAVPIGDHPVPVAAGVGRRTADRAQ